MAKKTTHTKNEEVKMMVAQQIHNSLLRRYDLIQTMLSPGRDVDTECHYPTSITAQNYRTMYDRFGVASRVVEILPEECWAQEPSIYEVEDAKKTPFEEEWGKLQEQFQIFHYMNRIDILSGIGQYGLVLFGIGDGKDLDKPVEGIDAKTGLMTKEMKFPLLFLRTYDESVISIDKKEENTSSPRYGFPTMYTVQFEDVRSGTKSNMQQKVHWTRVLHIADNRTSSEIYGTPRQQRVYNTLLDLRKVLGGSGEMFWKGGFPGMAFEMKGDNATLQITDDDKTSMKDNIKDYFAGLDRSLLLENVEVKPIAPQVADPTGHIEMQTKAIAISMGIPYRIFQGSEEAKQASTQDKRVWNERIMKRQRSYLTPMLVRPFIDRLIAYGVLPEPKQYIVEWPDREALTDKDIAEVAVKEVQAIKEYVQGEVYRVLPEKYFWTSFMKRTAEEAETFEKGVEDTENDLLMDKMENDAKGVTAKEEEGDDDNKEKDDV